MSESKRVAVRYFAQLKDERGLAEEMVSTTARTVRELYDELRRMYGLSTPAGALKVAVEDEFAEWASRIEDGDTVSFLPPVAGG